ncbi:hypothetical protein [Streptomyces sp. NPDC050704]|uniref:hypothetical protein n=1 Tax=Streptomyces sp. NPDC050704 TaxID=3157219 RepID=UPI003445CB3E
MAALFIALMVLYGAACGTLGASPGAPLWLRWPMPIWNLIAHDWRRPAPVPLRPDYARIDRLERELDIGDVAPERPIRRGPKVCLTKDCTGDTTDIRTWGGQLAIRIHDCEAP